MNNLLEESVVRPRGVDGAVRTAGLALDVRELPDEFVITASVPGVNPDQVEISILGDTLRIRGERREESERDGDGGRWLVRERRFGTFERTVALPGLVKTEGAAADFKDGVLTVTLPNAEQAKVHTIPVRGGQSGREQAIDVNFDETEDGEG